MNFKKKLLLITAIPPIPKESGGAVRIYNTIKCLSEIYDIYLILFKPHKQSELEGEEFYKKYTKKHFQICINSEKNNASFVNSFQPYWFYGWYNEELKLLTNYLIKKEKIKIIQIEFTQLLYIINTLPQNIKTCFTAHDISTVSFYRRLKEEKNIKRILVYFLRLIEIYLYEKKYLKKVDTIYSVSTNDKKLINLLFNVNNIINVPNGIEKINFLTSPNIKSKIRLGCIGSFSHPPNKYAFKYFLNKIAPILERERLNYEFILAGKNDPMEVRELIEKSKISNSKKIINMGFVLDTKEFFQKIDILVTPIFSGSGSRIKILDSLGFGKKVISSKIGAEGIEVKTKLISIANSPQEYVKKIKESFYKKEKIDFKMEKNNISKLTWKHIFTRIG